MAQLYGYGVERAPIRHRAVFVRIKYSRVPCRARSLGSRNTDGAGEHCRSRDGCVSQERSARKSSRFRLSECSGHGWRGIVFTCRRIDRGRERSPLSRLHQAQVVTVHEHFAKGCLLELEEIAHRAQRARKSASPSM